MSERQDEYCHWVPMQDELQDRGHLSRNLVWGVNDWCGDHRLDENKI
jgi:hypothetical protein